MKFNLTRFSFSFSFVTPRCEKGFPSPVIRVLEIKANLSPMDATFICMERCGNGGGGGECIGFGIDIVKGKLKTK